MDFRSGTTADLVAAVGSWLTSLGLAGVTSCERWEGDGVMMVSWQGPGITGDGDGPYFEVSGTDVPYFEPGVSLTIIRPKEAGCDDQIVIESPDQALEIFQREGYLPS